MATTKKLLRPQRRLVEKDRVYKRNQVKKIVDQEKLLVLPIAFRYRKLAGELGVSFKDVIQAGRVGLFYANRGFNPELSSNFKTYATSYIKGTILELLNERRAVGLRVKAKLFRTVLDLLERESKGANVLQELDKSRDLRKKYSEIKSQRDVESLKDELRLLEAEIKNRENPESLNSWVHDDSGWHFEERFLDSKESSLKELVVRDQIQRYRLRSQVQKLPDLERKIITAKYLLKRPLTNRELAKKLRVSSAKVCYVEHQALSRLLTRINKTRTVWEKYEDKICHLSLEKK